MKNDLSCDVVKDLLPSYIDELTSADSNKAVADHLVKCESCREVYKNMCHDKNAAEDNIQKEVDYLKGIKSRNRKKTRKAVFVTIGTLALIFVLFVFTSTFLIGQPANSYIDRPTVSVEDGVLYLEFHNPNSAYSYAHWKIDYIDPCDGKGTELNYDVKISARAPMSSVFYPSGNRIIEIELDNVHSVSFMGALLWQDELMINPDTEQIFARQYPYAGSAPQMGYVLGALKLPDVPYTTSIQSDSEPYGWTVHFKDALDGADIFLMSQNAPIVLSLVENLGEFGFTYPDGNGGEVQQRFSVEDIEELLPELYEEYNKLHGTDWEPLESLKDYTDSVYSYQQLLNVLNY